MTAQHALPQAALDAALVAAINRPCDELAVALYMSDMPDRQPRGVPWPFPQLAEWVRDGIACFGGDLGTWQAAYRLRLADRDGDWTGYRLFWDDPHREKTARRAADQITAAAQCAYKPAMAWVVVASCEGGHEWRTQVDGRDAWQAAQAGVVLR